MREGMVALGACTLSLAAAFARADATLDYQPFEGARLFTTHGYQELKLSDDRWYVAYQGSKDTSPVWIARAWATRSAQLCASSGAIAFVELRYPFEEVTQAKARAKSQTQRHASGALQRVATPIYIPIYGPPRAVAPALGPSKLAAVQCLSDPALLKDPARAVRIDDALDKARQAGISLRK